MFFILMEKYFSLIVKDWIKCLYVLFMWKIFLFKFQKELVLWTEMNRKKHVSFFGIVFDVGTCLSFRQFKYLSYNTWFISRFYKGYIRLYNIMNKFLRLYNIMNKFSVQFDKNIILNRTILNRQIFKQWQMAIHAVCECGTLFWKFWKLFY